jgi:hypothetical protein
MSISAEGGQRKLAHLESQLEAIRSQGGGGNPVLNQEQDPSAAVTAEALLHMQQQQQGIQNASSLSPVYGNGNGFQQQMQMREIVSPVSVSMSGDSQFSNSTFLRQQQQTLLAPESNGNGLKRNVGTGDFEVTGWEEGDVVSKGMISFQNAVLYFGTFFQGCVSLSLIFLPHVNINIR